MSGHYPLSVVKRLASKARVHGLRASKEVQRVLSCSEPEAERYARRVVADLEAGDFVKSILLTFPAPGPYMSDLYAVANGDGSWYVKFYIHNGRLELVSCHPPKAPLETKKGLVR